MKSINVRFSKCQHNYDMNTDELVVKEAYANEGPTLKRFRPRAQGRKCYQ